MNFTCSSKDLAYSSLGLTKHRINNGLNLYLDKGWTRTDDYFYKGFRSSWCKIFVDPIFRIETNELRDFPIFYDNDTVSNFTTLDNNLPADGVLEMDSEVGVSYRENFYPPVGSDLISQQDCHNILFDALIENVGTFASSNNHPIFMPAQGGIDTLTVRSVFDFLDVKYELFDLPSSAPNLSPLGSLLAEKHWGFMQVHEKPGSVVVTGFYGDEWVLRNPYYAHVLLSGRNVDIVNEFDKIESCYMKKYFEGYRSKCMNGVKMTVEGLMSQICNDFQIWHLHDTNFFSPLKHKSLLSLLTADTQTILDQVTDAKLSKSIIERCNPKLLDLIDHRKNQTDPDYFWN
jgi:hypothetical protein